MLCFACVEEWYTILCLKCVEGWHYTTLRLKCVEGWQYTSQWCVLFVWKGSGHTEAEVFVEGWHLCYTSVEECHDAESNNLRIKSLLYLCRRMTLYNLNLCGSVTITQRAAVCIYNSLSYKYLSARVVSIIKVVFSNPLKTIIFS